MDKIFVEYTKTWYSSFEEPPYLWKSNRGIYYIEFRKFKDMRELALDTNNYPYYIEQGQDMYKQRWQKFFR